MATSACSSSAASRCRIAWRASPRRRCGNLNRRQGRGPAAHRAGPRDCRDPGPHPRRARPAAGGPRCDWRHAHRDQRHQPDLLPGRSRSRAVLTWRLCSSTRWRQRFRRMKRRSPAVWPWPRCQVQRRPKETARMDALAEDFIEQLWQIDTEAAVAVGRFDFAARLTLPSAEQRERRAVCSRPGCRASKAWPQPPSRRCRHGPARSCWRRSAATCGSWTNCAGGPGTRRRTTRPRRRQDPAHRLGADARARQRAAAARVNCPPTTRPRARASPTSRASTPRSRCSNRRRARCWRRSRSAAQQVGRAPSPSHLERRTRGGEWLRPTSCACCPRRGAASGWGRALRDQGSGDIQSARSA